MSEVTSHDVGQMGKKVSDLVLCFSLSFAYSEAAKVWPIYRRRIVASNDRLMWLRYVLVIEINRLVKRAFDVAGKELVALWRQQRGREHTLKTHIEFERSRIMLQ